MNREHLYRAWHREGKVMTYKMDLIFDHDPQYNRLISHDKNFPGSGTQVKGYLKDFDLMEYTGRNDREGTRVYTSDILRDLDNKEFEVFWYGGTIGLRERGRESAGFPLVLIRDFEHEYKVVGNTYEEKERSG